MEVIPAVDLMEGKVVRLRKGDPNTSKNYSIFGDPLQTAGKWEREGAKAIHIVDLDAATGRGDNLEVIAAMIHSVKVPVQVGGGIRSGGKAEDMLRIGAERVIVATLAFERTGDLKELLKKYGAGRIMVALDYLNGKVMVRGWTRATGITLENAIQRFLRLGVKLYLLTSILRDGLLIGPDYVTLRSLVDNTEAELYAAGGVSSLEDLIRLKETGLKGVIVGKALYEGSFSLKEAIKAAED
jgi:phosphoribosylformimino-5-aminoimidazole carboxamide ribotide isomerase